MEKYLVYDFNDDYGREPIIRKAKNGTLICIFLTGGTWEPQNKNIVKIMKSYDDGKSWTEFKQTDIPNANTKITLIKINDMLVMINNFINNSDFDKRTHLQLFVSKDGVNWTKKLKLENDEDCFYYPHAFYDDNNKILYVVYENSKQFYLQKIPYEDLII